MASLEELGKALTNADAAGDVDAARALAGEITKMRQSDAVAAPTPAAAPPPEKPSKTYMQHADDVVRAIANGMTFGLADRFAAGMDAATGRGDGYGENLAKEQAKTDEFAQEHPVVHAAANLTGGLVMPVGVIGATAKGATLGAKTLIGAGTGGGIGAVQGALGSKDWTDPAQVAKDAAIGGGVGATIGAVMPGAAQAVGAGYQKVANAFTGKVEGMSRAAGGHLVRAVEADGPAAVQARVAELGPDAMLADAGPALLGKAQGASLNSDEGRSVLQGALTTRDRGTNARIQADVNQALGPAEDPQLVTDAIRAHRSAVDNVNYPAALENAPEVRTAHILTQIDDMLPRSVGNEHRALTNLRNMLMTTERRPLLDAQGHPQYDNMGRQRWQEVPVSQNDAEVLHKVKQELDNVIEYDAPGLGVPAGALQRQQGVLRHMRGQVNQALEEQVPGYANANAVSAALARRAEAVDRGTQYLGSGKTTPSPERFAAEFEPLSQGEKIALAKGSRGEVNRVLGTKANDLQALRGELQGEGGWNTDKLATVHGVPETNDLIASVDRNLKFRDTHNKVVENSQTAQRNAAAKEMKPDPSTETPLFNPNSTLTGMLATVGKKATQKVVDALTQSDPTRHYGEIARALSEQGAARDARLLAIVNAINSRQANAAVAPQVGNAGAVVAALLGKSAVDRLYVGPNRRPQQ